MEADQESSDGKVSIFVVLNVKEVSQCLPFSKISAFIAHPRNSHLPSCKLTILEVTVITVFDIVLFGLIDLTIVGNGSHQFCRLRSDV